MKTCTKCHIEKDEGEFYKTTNGYLFSECKRCNAKRCSDNKKKHILNGNQKEWAKRSYLKHRDKRLAENKKWRIENRERRNELNRKWREANPEKVALIRFKDKEAQRLRNKIYKKQNRKYYTELELKRSKIDRDKLSDVYIKQILKSTGFSKNDIESFPFLIEKKKLDLIIRRSNQLLKHIQNEKGK